MANETVSPTKNEARLGAMLSEIASIAYSANELLKHADNLGARKEGARIMLQPTARTHRPIEQRAHEEGARIMLQLIGAIADRCTEFSNRGQCAMIGSAEAWLGLTNFEIVTEETYV